MGHSGKIVLYFARSSNRSQHRIRFTLPAHVASNTINLSYWARTSAVPKEYRPEDTKKTKDRYSPSTVPRKVGRRYILHHNNYPKIFNSDIARSFAPLQHVENIRPAIEQSDSARKIWKYAHSDLSLRYPFLKKLNWIVFVLMHHGHDFVILLSTEIKSYLTPQKVSRANEKTCGKNWMLMLKTQLTYLTR